VQAIDEIRNSHNLILLGYVVMPEHVHLVVNLLL
jgi:REP element-mobilizing transposase RayT